jgi:hypothetical protein
VLCGLEDSGTAENVEPFSSIQVSRNLHLACRSRLRSVLAKVDWLKMIEGCRVALNLNWGDALYFLGDQAEVLGSLYEMRLWSKALRQLEGQCSICWAQYWALCWACCVEPRQRICWSWVSIFHCSSVRFIHDMLPRTTPTCSRGIEAGQRHRPLGRLIRSLPALVHPRP